MEEVWEMLVQRGMTYVRGLAWPAIFFKAKLVGKSPAVQYLQIFLIRQGGGGLIRRSCRLLQVES